MDTDTEKIEKPIKIKNGYEMLRELCAFNADFNAFTNNLNPITNRVQYIMHQLEINDIKFIVSMYQPILDVPDFVEGLPAEVNIVVEIEGHNKEITTIFTAHHDVANINSESCQDNSASVCNLLDLCIQLSKEKPANNVVICFNDSEERVSLTTSGATKIAKQILENKYGNVNKIFVLELTANGQNYWMGYRMSNMIDKPEIRRVRIPPSDSNTFEKNGLPSICIGSLNDVCMNNVITRGFCYTWSLCHSINDKFENANEVDMNAFVLYLKTLI